jgi:hypothetical protein
MYVCRNRVTRVSLRLYVLLLTTVCTPAPLVNPCRSDCRGSIPRCHLPHVARPGCTPTRALPSTRALQNTLCIPLKPFSPSQFYTSPRRTFPPSTLISLILTADPVPPQVTQPLIICSPCALSSALHPNSAQRYTQHPRSSCAPCPRRQQPRSRNGSSSSPTMPAPCKSASQRARSISRG